MVSPTCPASAGDSLLVRLLCGQTTLPSPPRLWDEVAAHRLLLLAVVAVALLLRVVVCLARAHQWRRHARRACWLAITPPVGATPEATVALWRLLATLLPRRRWWSPGPRHQLVWEIQAGPTGMRCGLWVPPGITPTAVTRQISRAWPGARTRQVTPVPLEGTRPRLVGYHLRPTRAEWLPLVAPLPAGHSRPGTRTGTGDDSARALFDGLAAAGRTGAGLLQVIVTRAPARRVRQARYASTHPTRTHPHRLHRSWLWRGAHWLLRETLDLFTPGARTPRRTPAAGAQAAELARLGRDKSADTPHLLVAVHALASGPTRAAAVAASADITAGFALLSAHLTRRRLYRAATRARWRWAGPSQMVLAGCTEVAALAGLPAEPTLFGLPAAGARMRPPAHDTWRAPPPAPATTPAAPTGRAPKGPRHRAAAERTTPAPRRSRP